MRIAHAKLEPYRLTFRQPLKTAAGTISRRRGLVLRLSDDQQRVGLGDAAPLPGFSVESYDEARAALEAAIATDAPLWSSSFASIKSINTFVSRSQLPPSAAHALDQALLDLLARRRRLPICRLLAYSCRSEISVHALVQDALGAAKALEAGFTTFKIKAGAELLDEDDARIEAIRAAVGEQGDLRLDANGAWANRSTAIEALGRLARHRICCVEQPAPATLFDLMVEIRAFSPIPIVADESMRTPADLEAIIARRAADAVVIKPMLCGGLQTALAMGKRAAAAGLPVSVTSTLESCVGRMGALHIAAALPGTMWPCGLLNSGLIDEDLATFPHPQDGKLALPTGAGLGITVDPVADPTPRATSEGA